MSIKVGCFALVNPFQTLEKQLDQIEEWGFTHADVTDSSDGACLGAGFGFTALASLDGNPLDLKRMFNERDITITSVCAHANLLDPSAPWRYSTSQIIKAVKMASMMGVRHVITTEGEPESFFGQQLSNDQAVFIIKEKLHEPIRIAEDLGVKILIEPHGPITGSIDCIDELLESCNSNVIALNLDTGNFWLGGGDPVEFVNHFAKKIEHIHWKDIPKKLAEQRGKIYGCGMTTVPLGEGVVDIEGVMETLNKVGFDGNTTLEIAGEEAVLESYNYLCSLGAE